MRYFAKTAMALAIIIIFVEVLPAGITGDQYAYSWYSM